MRILPRRKGVLGLLLAASVVLAVASTASAQARPLRAKSCFEATGPVETELTRLIPPQITIGSVTYKQTIKAQQIRSETRIYPKRRHCRFRGPYTLVLDVTVYQTVIRTPEGAPGANTIVEETIADNQTVITGHHKVGNNRVSVSRQEIAPSPPPPSGTASGPPTSGIDTAYGPVVGES